MRLNDPIYIEDLQNAVSIAEIEKLRNCTIVVTGACGLIGTMLVDCLLYVNRQKKFNLQVVAMGRSLRQLELRFAVWQKEKSLSLWEQDMEAPFSWKGKPDYIFQCASPAHPRFFEENPVGTFMTNVIGTRNLLDICRQFPSCRLLYLSTGEIYGENSEIRNGFKEQDYGYINTMDSRSCYPEGKRAAETLCASYHKQYQVDVVVARLCYIFGATISQNNTRADAQFLRKAAMGENIVMKSAGEQLRSYLYLSDCVKALIMLLLLGKDGEVYNVAGRNMTATVYEYALLVAQMGHISVEMGQASEKEVKGYSKVKRAVQNPDKLYELGFRPKETIASGVQRMMHIFKSAGCENE